MMARLLVAAVLVASASGLTLSPQTLGRTLRVPSVSRAVCMQEPKEAWPEPRATADQLSDETIKKAAEIASAPGAGSPGAPAEEDEGFDPRIILYVSLPALVLVGQLFFTFSRDALGDVALGPAVMDLYIP